MKLQSIEIQGFKSFRDKIKLQFNNPICAIVGPNGSGKSNISDAIRWVLGEQSVKSLRGSKMQDIIFSGTEKSKPLNFAQVSLNFDNTEKWIPIEFSEVNITRRVFRTGESEYYINKRQCRLKDLKELFLDTGIGKEGYSIIGQGRIDEILSSKSEDRRYIFEEASGISKFKYKKEESLKKLDKTISNLARIEDILIQKIEQRDFLKNQSIKAKEGMALINEIKFLDMYFNKLDLEKLKTKVSILLEENKSLKSDIEENREQIFKIEPTLEIIVQNSEVLKLEYEELERKLYIVEKQKNSLNLDLKISEEKIEHEKSELLRLKEEKEYIGSKRSEINEKLDFNFKSIEDAKVKLTKIDSAMLKYKASRDDLKEILEHKKILTNQINEVIVKNTNYINELEVRKRTQEGIEKSEVEKLKINKEKSSTIKNEIQNLDIKLEEQLKIKELKNLSQKKNLEEIDKLKIEISNVELKVKEFENEKYLLSSKSNDLKREYNFYKNVKDNYEGFNRQVSDFFRKIKNSKLKNLPLGTLADLISVDEKYAKAINNVLAGTLQNVVVENESDAKILIEFLKSERIGRLTFLPLTKIKSYNKTANISNPNIIAVASELIETKEEYRSIVDYFLSRTLIVENIEKAIVVSKNYRQFRIVTLDGDIFNSWGSIVGGFNKFKRDSNIINRSKNIDTLNLQIEDCDSKLSEIVETIRKAKLELSNIENDLQEKLEVYKKNQLELSIVDSEIKQIETNKIIKSNASEELENIIQEFNKKYNYVSEEEDLEELKIELSKKNIEYTSLVNEISEINTKVNYTEFELVKYESEKESLERDLKIKENFDIDYTNELNDLTQRYENNSIQIKFIEDNFSNRNVFVNQSKTDILKINAQYEELISVIPKKKKEYENISKKYMEEKDSLNDLKNILTKLEHTYEINLTKLENLAKDKEKIINFINEEYNVQIENVTLLKNEIKKTRSELKALKTKLKNLGYFSVDSIEEYEIVNEEAEFLSNQKEDLLKSKEDIENIIKSLDKDMKKMFVSSFNDINKRFNKIFSVLFDGGYAELELEENDILNSGIDIVAQPPGKKLQNLSLLSGGERALTAVALLFAIFETSPSPFCVLDEIDAALDEANIFRYTKYLKSFTDTTQFIMISHRKSTMEIADILYGVSMEEEGISKVISLELE